MNMHTYINIHEFNAAKFPSHHIFLWTIVRQTAVIFSIVKTTSISCFLRSSMPPKPAAQVTLVGLKATHKHKYVEKMFNIGGAMGPA